MGNYVKCLCVATALVAFSLVGLSGCGQSPQPRVEKLVKNMLDPELAKLSSVAALYQVNIKVETMMNCMLTDTFNKKKELSDKSQAASTAQEEIMRKIQNSAETKCGLFTKISKNTNAFFDKAKAAKKLPSESYVFYIYDDPDENNKYREQTIGLFETMRDCNQMEELARHAGIATKRCGLWQRQH